MARAAGSHASTRQFPKVVTDARELGEAFRAELGAIVAPALVVRGERSFSRPDQVNEVAACIPNAREATVRDAAHFMVREQPEQLARLVLDFLAPVLGRT